MGLKIVDISNRTKFFGREFQSVTSNVQNSSGTASVKWLVSLQIWKFNAFSQSMWIQVKSIPASLAQIFHSKQISFLVDSLWRRASTRVNFWIFLQWNSKWKKQDFRV